LSHRIAKTAQMMAATAANPGTCSSIVGILTPLLLRSAPWFAVALRSKLDIGFPKRRPGLAGIVRATSHCFDRHAVLIEGAFNETPGSAGEPAECGGRDCAARPRRSWCRSL